ncbi:COG1470 family protein [Paenarthrobacter nitroguajacolicus]|uniref:COG1470 family protein n=1 Tax=Paenarthrobacter nitroguajacolicus TaxID=211146 RepID=UPI004053A2AC
MQPQAARLRTPFGRAGVAVKAMLLTLLVVLASVASLGASGGQSNGKAAAAKEAKGIIVALSPSNRSLDQGQSAAFDVTISSAGGFGGTVTLSAAGLPPGTTAAWSPSSGVLSSGSSTKVTLTVSTSPTTPAGKYDFTASATGGTIQSNAAKAQLHVKEVKRNFGVSGSLTGALAPGLSLPIDLQISNPENKAIAVTNLSVTISQVVRTPAAVAAGLPCSAADYSITQFTGTYPITAQPGSSSLSALGVPPGSWPRISMLDTLLLQDGCKGATLELTYSGTGQAN